LSKQFVNRTRPNSCTTPTLSALEQKYYCMSNGEQWGAMLS
jgi:hypothetical protein